MSVVSLTQQQGKQQRVMQKTVFNIHTVFEWPPALTTLSQFTADELRGAWIRRKPGSVPSASGFTHLITLEFSWGLSMDQLEHYLLPSSMLCLLRFTLCSCQELTAYWQHAELTAVPTWNTRTHTRLALVAAASLSFWR